MLNTYDNAAMDSLGAFFISELENLDPIIHAPLYACTWSRDIPVRDGISPGAEFSSFLTSSFAFSGGIQPSGVSWVSPESSAIPSASVDTNKISLPIRPVAYNINYTLIELERSMMAGRPIDDQELQALNQKNQMDIDRVAYTGDPSTFAGYCGLINNPAVTVGTLHKTFDSSTAQEIQDALAAAHTAAWAATGYAVAPNRLLLPPKQFGLLNRTVSSAGTMSIIEYLRRNNIFTTSTGGELEIFPVKWLEGPGSGTNSDRAVFYTMDPKYIRFPMVPLRRGQITPQDLWIRTTYWGQLGQVEFLYPETVYYLDGV